MLDPLTALSLAGNVVQFIQFGCSLAATAHDVHTSNAGGSKENLEMEAVTSRLLQSVEDLESDHARAVSQTDVKTPTERRLLEISESCTMVANDILRRLQKLKLHVSPTVWNSVSRAFKCAWSRDELNDLTRRLRTYISELETTILISLK